MAIKSVTYPHTLTVQFEKWNTCVCRLVSSQEFLCEPCVKASIIILF